MLVHHFSTAMQPAAIYQVYFRRDESLLHYDWSLATFRTGNCVARAVTLAIITLIDYTTCRPPSHRAAFRDSSLATGLGLDSTTALAEMERHDILRVFEQANGDKALAGKMLGISAHSLPQAEALQHSGKAASPATPEQQRAPRTDRVHLIQSPACSSGARHERECFTLRRLSHRCTCEIRTLAVSIASPRITAGAFGCLTCISTLDTISRRYVCAVLPAVSWTGGNRSRGFVKRSTQSVTDHEPDCAEQLARFFRA